MLTVSGIAKRGFFIPSSHAAGVSASDGQASYRAAERVFRSRQEVLAGFLAEMESWSGALFALGGGAPPAPRWDQDWFPRLDAAAAYAMVRHFAPRRIIEIGSGHSTRFIVQAVRDAGIAADITAIDPAPRASLDTLPVRLRRCFVQDLPLETFAGLKAGDLLMVDSSHILVPGSDVDFVFGRLLPFLPAGVIVHVHDVFLPDGYPEDWEWRGYNEQQVVLTLLTSPGWDLLHASHYVVTRMADRFSAGPLACLPLVPGARESSLWLRKTVPALGPAAALQS